jgi:hypothetical protein
VDRLLARAEMGDWRAKMNFNWETLVVDLDRCPHGRHMGDVCGGWRGPGPYDGGCFRGVSLGNPLLPVGKIIGTSLSRSFMIRVPSDRYDRVDARGWYIPLDGGLEAEYLEAVNLAVGRNGEDGLDG